MTKEQASEAMCRVAQATIDEANERREGGGSDGRASENVSRNDSAAINAVSRHRNMRKALKESKARIQNGFFDTSITASSSSD